MNLTIKKLALASTIALATTTWADTATSANVMAPLIIDNWSDFQNDLNDAKSIGVTGVSVDVWWGKVEAGGDQQFDWSYYDQVFQTIENAGLDIVPIMSFHQCGGNVGDDCNVPLPSWIWNHYSNEGVYASDLKYRSEYDNESVETISLWRDEYVLSEYREFMEAFETHFAAKADNISEINISMGPAGELRYPSYNSHDKKLTDFPTRGGLQAYSAPAIQDFQDWAVDKYGGINGINTAWGFGLSSVDQVGPPSNVDSFINNGDQFNTQYGKDFFSWYHESLIQHGVRMMDNALVSLDGAFSDIELGFKIPGVHWKMSAPDNTRRSAEMAAGLIPSDSIDSPNGHGYESIISVASRYNNESRGVVLHFTCLEMNDSFSDGYSMAKTLVGWVADEAERQGVAIKGENALWGGVTWSGGWDNIRSAFTNHSYSGLTVLRLEQVSGGSAGQNQYESFISDYLVIEGDWERTVIFIYGQTVEGQDMFVRGGIDHGYANTNLGRNCQTWNFECAIPIRHNNLRNDTTTPWKSGDLYLDWYGAESGQSAASVGSPLDWTTSDSSNPNKVAVQGFGYETLNDYGDHYWMLDVEMDCSKTVNGWFELKSYISNGPEWEGDVAQSGTPYSSGNHFAECGKLNVFQRGSSSAIIGDL